MASSTLEQQKLLLKWFLQKSRNLPWRGEFPRDPYQVWISEIMLQQTQVSVVVNYFQKWMKRFPYLKDLAKSSEQEVLQYWSGLGYYSRARNILKTAQIIQKNGGKFPTSKLEVLSLPGIGKYTAGAILSFAFEQSEPILDGNVKRLWSRFYGINFFPQTVAEEQVYWNYSKGWANLKKTALTNEALIELGALICTVKNPLCTDCPLKKDCYACIHKQQAKLPRRKSYPKIKKVILNLLIIHKQDKFLLVKKGLFLKSQYQFLQLDSVVKSNACYDDLVFSCVDFVGEFSHRITHHEIKVLVYAFKITSQIFKNKVKKKFKHEDFNGKWVLKKKLSQYLNHALGEKTIELFLNK